MGETIISIVIGKKDLSSEKDRSEETPLIVVGTVSRTTISLVETYLRGRSGFHQKDYCPGYESYAQPILTNMNTIGHHLAYWGRNTTLKWKRS